MLADVAAVGDDIGEIDRPAAGDPSIQPFVNDSHPLQSIEES